MLNILNIQYILHRHWVTAIVSAPKTQPNIKPLSDALIFHPDARSQGRHSQLKIKNLACSQHHLSHRPPKPAHQAAGQAPSLTGSPRTAAATRPGADRARRCLRGASAAAHGAGHGHLRHRRHWVELPMAPAPGSLAKFGPPIRAVITAPPGAPHGHGGPAEYAWPGEGAERPVRDAVTLYRSVCGR